MSNETIETKRERVGPFERVVLTAPDPIRPAAQSVYKIGDTLIDAASTRVAPTLIEVLADAPPRRILLTHQHEDHAGGVGAIRRAFGHIPVYVARSYLPLLTTVDRVPEYRARFWGHPELVHDAIPFDPGHVFELPGVTLHTLETPGHTPFHITFVLRKAEATYALTGDLFTSASPLIAWFESAAEDTSRSCRLVASSGKDLQLLPTHGKTRTNGAETLLTLAAWMEEKTAEVMRAAERLGTQAYQTVAHEAFGQDDIFAKELTEGEYSYANFVRSVFDPVRALPAVRLA